MLFGMSDDFTAFINHIITKWGGMQQSEKGEKKQLMLFDTKGKYRPQMKIKYSGAPLTPGAMVKRFTFDTRCYAYRKAGVLMCGVYFKNREEFEQV